MGKEKKLKTKIKQKRYATIIVADINHFLLLNPFYLVRKDILIFLQKTNLLLFIANFVLDFGKVKVFAGGALENVQDVETCSFEMSCGII